MQFVDLHIYWYLQPTNPCYRIKDFRVHESFTCGIFLKNHMYICFIDNIPYHLMTWYCMEPGLT